MVESSTLATRRPPTILTDMFPSEATVSSNSHEEAGSSVDQTGVKVKNRIIKHIASDHGKARIRIATKRKIIEITTSNSININVRIPLLDKHLTYLHPLLY